MRPILSAALAASLSTAMLAAPAFTQDPTPAQPQAAPQTFELTDEQVTDFITAARGINELIAEVQPELEAASSDAERQSIQQDARLQMAEIVTETGLTVVEYNSIANAARTDDGIATRIRNAAMAGQGAQ